MTDKNRVWTIKNMFQPQGVDDAMAEYLLGKCYEIIKDTKNPSDKPPRTELTEALRRYFNLDFSQIEAVMDYAYGKSQDRDKANDYAVAKILNERAIEIFTLYADNSNTPDISEMNRCYVLLADELNKIYDHTPELKNIPTDICWRSFDRIEHIRDDLWDYSNNNHGDYGKSHNAVVNTLLIKNEVDKPNLTNRQKELIAKSDKAIANFKQGIEHTWYIPEYYVERSKNGTIVVNGKLELSKPNTGSVPDMIMDFAFRNDGKDAQKPTKSDKNNSPIATDRPYTTTLGELGFDKILRAIFFPTVSKHKGIAFRSRVSRAVADSENIDTNSLDFKLNELGVGTVERKANAGFSDDPINLDDIPF